MAFQSTQVLGSYRSSLAGAQLSLASTSRAAPNCRCGVSAAIFGPGKKWEHLEVNKNGNTVVQPIHVRKGDTVQIIAGKDKGKIGEITQVLPKYGQVVVEGVNVKAKTKQPKSKEEQGQIVQTETPVHHSNVQAYSTKEKVRSRVGHKMTEDGKKVRYLLKTGEVLAS